MKALLALRHYLLRYKWRFLFGIVFVFLANFFAARVPVSIAQAINGLTNRAGLVEELIRIGIFIVALAGLGACFRYLMRRILIDTSRDIEFDFRNDLYLKLQTLDAAYYDKNNTGDIMSRMTNDVDMIRMVLGPAIMYATNTLFVVPIMVISMVALDWVTTLAGLVPICFLPFIVKYFGTHLHRGYRGQQDQLGDLTTFVQESLAGIRVVKAYAQEQKQEERFEGENQKFIDISMDLAKTLAFFRPSIQFIVGLGTIVILLVGAYRIARFGMGYGDLTGIILLYLNLVWPMIAAGWVINLFQRASASLDRIKEITDATSLVADAPTVVAPQALPERLDIRLQNLTFTYPGASEPVLEDITLDIPQGTTLGIIGRVGAGKSSLVHLLLRMYPVQRGMITLGGIDINDWPLEELRRRIALVQQETFLFSETIAENIRFGALEPISDERMQWAATVANVHGDITGFPKGYDTILGERGINLSGGQKQRTSIARALVRETNVLVLDDALSAVDTQTEERILSALREMLGSRTVILISHRISTVSLADQIIVIEDRRVSQRGTHNELLTQGGLYADLHRRQLLEEEVEAIG